MIKTKKRKRTTSTSWIELRKVTEEVNSLNHLITLKMTNNLIMLVAHLKEGHCLMFVLTFASTSLLNQWNKMKEMSSMN
jgi:hypothetical protein